MRQPAARSFSHRACYAGLVLVVATRPAAASQGSIARADSAIVDLTVRQITLDRMALGLPVPAGLGGDQLSIERIDSVGPAQIYRVTPWIFQHWHPYLVAVSATRASPLGGFPAPEPLPFASEAGLMVRSEQDAQRLGRVFAKLLDPNGSGVVAFAQDSLTSDELRLAWQRAARRGLPTDTALRTQAGGIHVRLTVLSRLARQYPPAWQPVTFVFEFGASGQFKAWAMRIGEASFALDKPG